MYDEVSTPVKKDIAPISNARTEMEDTAARAIHVRLLLYTHAYKILQYFCIIGLV